MIIKQLTVGPIQVNNYVVIDEESKDAIIIDNGGETDLVLEVLKEHGATLKYILNTHGHFDHIYGEKDLKETTGAKVLIHKDDEYLVQNIKKDCALFGMTAVEPVEIDEFIEDGQEIVLSGLTFKVIHTPGHTPGGVCYLIDNILFAGDTLFKNSIGRTDLPKGDFATLSNSIKSKLFTLDENITVYCGHGAPTTIGYEKLNNPYIGARVAAF